MNALLSPYKDAQYADLLWMANLIAQIDGVALRKMVDEANWPEPLATLYYYKLASRRENILNTFHIKDPHPIQYDIYYSVKENGEYLIENGLLMKEIQPADHPEHFLKHEEKDPIKIQHIKFKIKSSNPLLLSLTNKIINRHKGEQ